MNKQEKIIVVLLAIALAGSVYLSNRDQKRRMEYARQQAALAGATGGSEAGALAGATGRSCSRVVVATAAPHPQGPTPIPGTRGL